MAIGDDSILGQACLHLRVSLRRRVLAVLGRAFRRTECSRWRVRCLPRVTHGDRVWVGLLQLPLREYFHPVAGSAGVALLRHKHRQGGANARWHRRGDVPAQGGRGDAVDRECR
ncbi:hypothetical protein DPEC_G00349300 [Dallia pectoralis]|uniref:Uncharacterized protein n=1 Tax=Dallia pectoralis TaxID=75939 RepID=A0ACC2F1R4_DALPE|nr:hypothetical protein DPEC_G00349300 [Dallia pectoralis]